MQEQVNRQVALVGSPKGGPTEDDFRIIEVAIPELKYGQVLVRREKLKA